MRKVQFIVTPYLRIEVSDSRKVLPDVLTLVNYEDLHASNIDRCAGQYCHRSGEKS